MSAIKNVFAPAPEPKTELGRYRVLSTTAGVRVSPLCLGAMSIGSAWSSFLGSMEKDQSYKLLDAFVEAGGNFIDTANNYQNEESEQILGEWMAARRNRDIMFVATKFTTQYRKHELGPGKCINYSGNHKKSLHLSVRDSLRKLQTDYIDLLYVHWWDWTTSIEELMDSLHILVEQGKVLYLGVSDTPAWIVSAANTYAKAQGKTPFSVYQGRWNVLIRDVERDIIPMARHFGMALCPWDVLGGGKLQSMTQLEARQKAGEGLRCTFGPNQSDEERKASEVLEQIAKEHGTESIQQIALAYVMQKARYVFPVVGGRKVENLEDNIKALSICLTEEQIQTIESIKKFHIGFPMDFILDDPREGGPTAPLVAASAPMDWQLQGKPIGQE
ncbi:aldo/keto reductase [Colletotrichum graminicola]|uniref:Aldo-keto reductase ausK n=1 Tax=Colletotrichum graminicola (strain M1.001 / M2 / FGSC 10212) TaxID=645133 RepID=E3QDG7_COLGM|nr:aldo/keto reductase [Colletotrichum graminicola M1.001]EFQ28939.1 aldo/keto reductase [Colletotrichum graminicola M1.001]WDK19129.1 aldo/keto reductase [Colletotrichum graminicola]